jgi:hypothetical protein
MDQKKLSDWLQIVGMFGVIASLLFVGLQMKQSHEIALSATYQARAQLAVDQNLASSGNPQFTSATAKLYSGEIDAITPEELVALEYNFAATVIGWENQHYQFASGFLPEEHWQKSFEDMHCMFSSSIYRGLLEGWGFRPSFQKILDEAKKGAAENPNDCWTQIVLPANSEE